jgi:crossover junction endodeoxyribonuclease RuvC
MTTLGVDPGTICTGFAIVRDGRVVDYGTIRPHRFGAERRYHILFKAILALVQQHQIANVAVETQYVARNPQSALKLGMARGAIIAAAFEGGAEVFQYTPSSVKKAVTGRGGASKHQVAAMLQHIYQLAELPTPEDASDGLALATCHLQRLRLSSTRRSMRVSMRD